MDKGSQLGVLSPADWMVLAPHRAQLRWEILEQPGALWLSRPVPSESIPGDPWRALPFVLRGVADAKRRFVAEGAKVASEKVPDGEWTPLTVWIPLGRQAAQFPGRPARLAEFRPVRAYAAERPSDLRLVGAEVWRRWAVTAPRARLALLAFAASSDGRICVRGRPAPPLPGTAWTVQGGIALPAGYGHPSGFLPEWLAEVLGLQAGDLALWHDDGSTEIIPAAAFLPASRSNVRATAGASLPV